MSNKGFTVVELIVSFAITMIVAVFLFQTIIILKDYYISTGVKSQLLSKQTIISSKINDDFYEKGVKIALKCGSNCLNFFFNDNSNNKLIVDKVNGIFTYGNYTTKLIEGSEFGDFIIDTQTVINVEPGKNNSYITVKIPITHPLLKGDYGINVIYQYDSRTSSIQDIAFNETEVIESGIVLIGQKNMNWYNSSPYSEPGYYVISGSGTIVLNSPSVTITGTVGTTVGQTYTLTYTLKDGSNNVIDTEYRYVTIATDIDCFYFSGYNTITGYSPTCSRDVVIPNGIVTISNNAFGWEDLTSVTLPSSLTSIEDNAFINNSITNLIIPSGVTSIGKEAFEHNQISNLSIPNSVTNIAEGAFNDNQLPDNQAIIFARNNDGSVDNTKIVSYGGINKNVTIPNGVVIVGNMAFAYNQITGITIPNSVTTLNVGAFYSNKISNVVIPNGVITISDWAFSDNLLTTLTIPSSVTSIGGSALTYNQLNTITMQGSSTTIGDYLLTNVNNNFRTSYIAGGAGTYIGTQTGTWTKS